MTSLPQSGGSYVTDPKSGKPKLHEKPTAPREDRPSEPAEKEQGK